MSNQNLVDAFGYAGAVFLTLLTFPQVYHCYKNKTSKGLTVSFLFLEFMTSVCFICYGALLPSLHVIIANTSALVGTILLIIAKIIYKSDNPSDTIMP